MMNDCSSFFAWNFVFSQHLVKRYVVGIVYGVCSVRILHCGSHTDREAREGASLSPPSGLAPSLSQALGKLTGSGPGLPHCLGAPGVVTGHPARPGIFPPQLHSWNFWVVCGDGWICLGLTQPVSAGLAVRKSRAQGSPAWASHWPATGNRDQNCLAVWGVTVDSQFKG